MCAVLSWLEVHDSCPLGTSVAIECGAMYSFVQYAQRNKQIVQSLLHCDG